MYFTAWFWLQLREMIAFIVRIVHDFSLSIDVN